MFTSRLFGLLLAGLAASAAADALRPADRASHLAAFDAGSAESRIYIVQLKDPPALAYRGGRNGLTATRPDRGLRIDPDSTPVARYRRYLTRQQDALLRSVGAYPDKLYSYRYAFNGFAARLTPMQANKLRARRQVARVWEDQVRYLATNDSPSFLGLFDTEGGLRTAKGLDGSGVVIGIIDSGIAPEHPSFANPDRRKLPRLCRSSWAEDTLLGMWLCFRWKHRDAQPEFPALAGWRGRCETGDRFTAGDCNGKIVGARYYIDGFLQTHLLDPNEFISPRDADGHGTHIASIAAGKEVRASIGGNDVARISGMAPGARIAVYKACWLEPGQTRGSCSTADLQRAIEDAVADGVDIINYSVGNTDISISDPDDLALLAASDAGVLSVVAAGNDGPAPATVLSPAAAPWVLTVGASSRTGIRFDSVMRVDSPVSIAGNYAFREASFTPALRDTGPVAGELVAVVDAAAGTGGGSFLDACESIVNSTGIAGRIAFLQRGLCTFETKLINVERAGAIAAVVFDDQGGPITMSGTRGSVNIPAVMVSQTDGETILAQMNSNSVTVTLDYRLIDSRMVAGDVVGDFSSRGPNPGAPNILKPDVMAPGIDILAAQTPDVANGLRGELFQYLSGSSMAVPHVAGVAALLKQAHPDWTPGAIKSALMTTARQNLFTGDGTIPAGPFDIGAGHIVPDDAIDPGLVYPVGQSDYDAFLCGAGMARVTSAECDALEAAGVPNDAAGLNQPAIAVSTLINGRTLQRTVMNVGAASTWQATVNAPPGIDARIEPATLSLDTGDSGRYTISLAADGAPLYDWQFGAVSWSDGTQTVRSPLAVRPVPLLAPTAVTGKGMSGSTTLNVEFGYSGAYTATVHGLVPADIATGQVMDDPLNDYLFEPDTDLLPDSVSRFQFDVGNDIVFLRVALFNNETDGDDDLDLYVYYCPGLLFCELVGSSGESDSDERVEINPFATKPISPTGNTVNPGEYFVDVHGFQTDETTGGPGANFSLFVWTVARNGTSNLTVTGPGAATAGTTAPLDLEWNLAQSGRYLGGITHADSNGPLEFTVVTIDP